MIESFLHSKVSKSSVIVAETKNFNVMFDAAFNFFYCRRRIAKPGKLPKCFDHTQKVKDLLNSQKPRFDEHSANISKFVRRSSKHQDL